MLQWRWWIWFFLVAVVANAESERAILPNGLVCYRTASMFLFRDAESSCGKKTTFCTVPLSCYMASSMQYVGGSVATCRANVDPSLTETSPWNVSGLYCPGLQDCIDDERQEFINEGENFRSSASRQPAPSRPFPLTDEVYHSSSKGGQP